MKILGSERVSRASLSKLSRGKEFNLDSCSGCCSSACRKHPNAVLKELRTSAGYVLFFCFFLPYAYFAWEYLLKKIKFFFHIFN